MCGIAGALSLRGAPVEPGRLEPMIERLRHRGPDETGFVSSGEVALGHARLSILDLEGGRQPMTNEDRSVWVAFNGEIFNYVELREQLAARGWRFRTRSDTEVLLRLYEERGPELVHALNGQWAFAIWDARRRRLLLSRDRHGVLPLHWAEVDGELVFASEIKALFADPRISREPDLRALDQAFTFWFPLAPRTPFAAVRELPAAHQMIVENGAIRVQRYWDVDFTPRPAVGTVDAEAEKLLALLEDATRIRLRADVPVGAYLSGGLDSSIIAALVSRVHPTRPRTFSVAFRDREFDETVWQDAMVRHLGTEHVRVECTQDEIARVFPRVVWHAERPLLRTAPAPMFLLSGLVRDHGYKVVLTGEGSDEFLGGYDLFKETKVRAFWARQPDSELRPRLLQRLYPWMPRAQAQSASYLRAFFQVKPGDVDAPYFSHLPRWNTTARIKAFYSDEVRAALSGYDPLAEAAGGLPAGFAAWPPFARAQYLEAAWLLPGYLLASQGDRMLMAHSVEGRFPFLDHRVVEFAAGLPLRHRMRVLDEKHLLKRAARMLLPEGVLRRPKQPYRAPDAATFFRAPEARAWVRETLAPEALRKSRLFDPEAVARLLAKAESGRMGGARDNMALVGILSTQLLASTFVEQGAGTR